MTRNTRKSPTRDLQVSVAWWCQPSRQCILREPLPLHTAFPSTVRFMDTIRPKDATQGPSVGCLLPIFADFFGLSWETYLGISRRWSRGFRVSREVGATSGTRWARHTHTYIHTYICIYIYIHIYIFMIYTYICICTHTYIRIYLYIHIPSVG